MLPMIERLVSLRVADLMSTPVVSLRIELSLEQAAAEFNEKGISCAPVVDAEGKCVGILSASDFVRVFGAGCSREHLVEGRGGWRIEPCSESIAAVMTSAVQTIGREESLATAARMLCAQHVHHLVVIDAQGRPQGMLSTLDLSSALLNVVEEWRADSARPLGRSAAAQ